MKKEVERLLSGRGLQVEFKELSFNLELNMNYICKDTIKKRKSLYGNNFKEISRLQSEYLGIKVTEKDVAINLAILKKVRIDFIKSKLQELKENPRFGDYDIQIQIKGLNDGLLDSTIDFNNYLWIALNYEEYESL